MTAALKRFRVMAWIVGVMLLLLVGVAMPLKYAADNETAMGIIGPAHGLLYMIFLVTAFDLAVKAKWPFLRTLGVLLSGVVPALSFFVERKVTGWVRAETAPTNVTTSAN